eukprot:COSAG02_NODE_2370_length_9046_cov_22.705264_6_plen_88_part_00
MDKAATSAGNVEQDVTSVKVTGSAFDAEKMTVGSLAGGLAVKVKGDTFKRSGLPNSRFEILQQGYAETTVGIRERQRIGLEKTGLFQ